MVVAAIAIVVCIHHTASILVSSHKKSQNSFTYPQYPKNHKNNSAKVCPASCPQQYQMLKK